MRRWLRIILAGLSCWAGPSAGTASQISLQTQATSFFKNGEIRVTVDITNKGDEPAHSIQVEASIGSRTVRSLTRDQLPAGGIFPVSVELGSAPTPPGMHTIILRVHYTDGRGYPFTAVTSVPVVSAVPNSDHEPINARLTSAWTRRHNEVILTLAAQTNLTLDAHISLVLPEELKCPKPEIDVAIPPREEQRCRFQVDNVSGLPGSTYTVIAVIDYMLNGQHRSATATGSVSIKTPDPFPLWIKMVGACVIVGLLIAFGILQFKGKPGVPSPRHGLLLDLAVLAVLLGFTLCFIPPPYLILDTTTVGGDTPAHNYLASHLADQLFHHGRIVSWAGGWWCGFPMFQFYFCLPYLLMALLSVILPFNIAFKLICVLGILALPACAYGSARWMRLPRPGPTLLAIAMIPFLFDGSHTMWGVNIFSTLAGMISNSLSFAIMLLAIGSAFRDADDGQFRLRTVLLLVALLASHFFTSVVAGLTLLVLPFLRPAAGPRKALQVLAAEGALAVLLMAWWLIPLFTTQAFTAEFGTNWDLKLHGPSSLRLITLSVFALVGLVLAFLKRHRFAPLMLWMLIISLFLLFFGFRISPVFVNVRLWPFVFYALLALGVTGVAFLVAGRRVPGLLLLAALIGALLFGTGNPLTIRNWAQWNFEGLEKKPRWPVFAILVLPLDETPGRLANDLHEDNDSLGSTRVFEAVPALIKKSILEGGIVGSAAGSVFSYYIQSETSKNCAGFPEIVKPTTFNFTNATRHLELFNVKHFIARWSETKAALARSPAWRKVNEVQGWELYELTTHDGRYVFVPSYEPMAVRTRDFKLTGLDWIYTIEALDQPFVLLGPNEATDARWDKILSPAEYQSCLSNLKSGAELPVTARPVERKSVVISNEEVSDNRIRFTTTGLGLPHIIKCSYFPNWKVRGARRVYLVTPDFMLVYPEQADVELYYGFTWADYTGLGASSLGLLILIVLAGAAWRRRRTGQPGISAV